MKHNLKFQLELLKEKELEIERAAYELARSIFVNNVPYDLVITQRDKLFRTIEEVQQAYKTLFSFNLHYSESRSLDNAKSDINDWIDTAYARRD